MVHLIIRALRRLAPWSPGAGLGLVALAASASLARAQAGAVTGTVVDSKSGRPIVEASVAVENAATRARTNVRGEFRLAGVSGTVRLVVSRIGYQPQTVSATAGGNPVRIELEGRVVKLGELVVTRTAAQKAKRTMC